MGPDTPLPPRLLELLESELEARDADRQYAHALERFTCPAPSKAPAPAQPVEQPPAEYVGTREAAALLGVSVATLEALRARGKGPPFIRVGRRVRYSIAELRKGVR